MKNIEDVKVGDIATDYNGETHRVISTAKNYSDAMVKFPDQMCDYSSGVEDGFIDEDDAVLLVWSELDNEKYVFSYGYHGAYVVQKIFKK